MSTLRVFITVDTEVWPLAATPDKLVPADFARDYYGMTTEGEFGAVYQADVLHRNGLRGVFFVETLASYISGLEPLKALVSKLLDRDQEVGLHVHAEWCRRDSTLIGGSCGDLMRSYSEEKQTLLIAKALQQLRACGVTEVRSFRAGGYGANFDTLKALARNNIPFDSSHNQCWMGRTCDMPTATLLLQPKRIDGVYEYPVTFFVDRPNHTRHAEICACSTNELEFMLLQAHQRKWHSIVIVSHSFELIRRDPEKPSPIRMNIRRFERLCRFLAQHRDKFTTSTFHDDGLDKMPVNAVSSPLAGRLRNTMRRHMEQAWKKIA